MVLRGERHIIVSENANRGYWTGGHYPEAWTPVSVFKRYDREPRGSGVEPHYHDGDEFWLFAEGEGEVWLGDRVYPITPNTAVYTPRGVVHRFQMFTEFQNNALVTRLEVRQRQGHLVPAADGEPRALAAPIIVGGEENSGPFLDRGPRCPLSELRVVDLGTGEVPSDLDGAALTNEHLLVLSGAVELTADGVTVTVARGDVALLRADASRRVASTAGARVALARE
ncbi:MAG: cupin domain-containing protein [Spirochaetaceae bacterium]|nr:cupin domain-containing protein [Spirochaetaceae bacterium]